MGRRLLAFACDWMLILVWGGIVFGVFFLAEGGLPSAPEGPWHGQLRGLVTMTLPVVVGFAACEASRQGATPGKRLLGLRVTRAGDEARPGFARTLARNGLKFLPWECGHLVAWQAIHAGDAGMPLWVWIPMIASFAGPLWWLAALAAHGRTPYDRASGCAVVSARA